MTDLAQEGENRFRRHMASGDLEQMMPILLSGIEPEMLCYRKAPFLIMLQQELLRSIRYSTYMTLVLINLGKEKQNSGTFREVVGIVRRCIRTTDIIGDYGEDGILGIVLLHAPAGPSEVVTKRIREELAMFLKDPEFLDDSNRIISVVCPVDANSWTGLLNEAQTRLGLQSSTEPG